MNKFQRAQAGIYGSIENALDDIRNTFERVVYDRKVTGEVSMFVPEAVMEHAATESLLEHADYYPNPDYGNGMEQSQQQGMDIE